MAYQFDPKVIVDRQSLCVSGPEPGVAVHGGDHGFSERVQRHFTVSESEATERLVELKADLAVTDTESFWSKLMEGMTEICSAQYGFVAKRILVEDHDVAVEMPPIGTMGSCLMGVAFYYNDGHEVKAMHRDYKYLAWGAPCAHMKHDKVFLIPENLQEFILNNPNRFPFPSEAYLGVPLFSAGKCFAHFGLMWSKEGLERRNLSWGFVEMILHSLEDLILGRLLAGESFAKSERRAKELAKRVIPQEAITTNQSLKPYARSLSHELRTPMQGVVGMLDVMHATVQEAIEGQGNAKIRNIFQILRENIEVVQDSSRRAVEAADNVVHAYDMNMQLPETPQAGDDESPGMAVLPSAGAFETRPNIFIEGSNIPVNPYKRRRSSPLSWNQGSNTKQRDVRHSPRNREVSPRSQRLGSVVKENSESIRTPPEVTVREHDAEALRPVINSRTPPTRTNHERDTYPPPGTQHSKLREILHMVINEGLLVGGRPDSAIAEDTELGERIEVRTRSSNGHASAKFIDWSVAPDVPETLMVDERDLTKLISCVFLNAVKFTEVGTIAIIASVTPSGRSVLLKVTDTGMGIPNDFLPELFKPFSREDDSLTRSKEGLGLGLLVAKGLARKIGGDIECVRSETDGVNHGSEFDIKIPMGASETPSRAHSPFERTLTPSKRNTYHLGSNKKDHASHVRGSLGRDAKSTSPLHLSPPSRQNSHPPRPAISTILDAEQTGSPRRMSSSTSAKMPPPSIDSFDRKLAEKHPLTIMVVEDNKINRKLLVTMLSKLGYKDVYEAFDGREAVRVVREVYDALAITSSSYKRASNGIVKSTRAKDRAIDVILMDLWMPEMDGYEATEKIFEMSQRYAESGNPRMRSLPKPTVLAVSADVTDETLSRATMSGMEGFMTKPYKLTDLQRLIEAFCDRHLEVEEQ